MATIAASPQAYAEDARLPADVVDLPAAVAAARVMVEQLDRIAAQEAAVRAGDDPEAVHRMRVGARRLRTAVRLFRPWLPAVDGEQIGGIVRELATALGRARDLDVFAEGLRAAADPDDRAAVERLVACRAPARAEAQAALVAALDNAAYNKLVGSIRGELEALAASPNADDARRRDTFGRLAPKLVAGRLKRLRRRGRDLVAPTTGALHRTRIAAKRFRYAAEFVAPAFPGTTAEPIALGRAVQDTLGAALDADLAIATLLDELAQAPSSDRAPDAPTIARLIQRKRAERDENLARFAALWPTLPEPAELRTRLEAEAR